MLNYHLPLTRYPYVGEIVECPVCGAAGAETIARLDRRLKRLPTALCGACGLLFSNPMPTEAELSSYYRDVYRFDYQFARNGPSRRHVAKKAAEAARRVAVMRRFCDLGPGVRTLDFGCGSGELARRFAQEGCDAHGFEPGAAYVARADGGGAEIRGGVWRDMTYPSAQFDIVTCLHVLEHLREPVSALERIADWLAPNGLLYLETPDLQGYDHKSFERFHFAHVLGFTQETLIHAAQRAGFGVLWTLGGASLILSKSAAPVALDFESVVRRNRAAYGGRTPIAGYLAHHARRIGRRVLGRIRPVR